jgi:hypothetical protein
MVIKIDIHSLNEKFKSVIIHDINTECQHNLKNHTNVRDDDKEINHGIDNDHYIITLDRGKGNIQKIERMIKDILIKRRIDDYVAIQDAKEKDKIVILKREHGEQLGIYHCRHCGMAFEDEIQLTAHQRIHFFI